MDKDKNKRRNYLAKYNDWNYNRSQHSTGWEK